MDRAPAAPEDNPEDPGPGRPPSIGVPSIPAQADRRPPPAPVPSVPLPPSEPEETTGPDGPVDPGAPVAPPRGDTGADQAVTPEVTAGRPSTQDSHSAPSRPRRTVPVVSTRSKPLPVERGSRAPGSGDSVGPDPGEHRDPFTTTFPPGVAAKLGWYVYLMTDPGSGQAFYVGRGRGDRCFRHLRAARVDADRGTGMGGEDPGGEPVGEEGRPRGDGHERPTDPFPMLERIREVEADHGPVQLEILRHRLTSDEARLVQAAVADTLGLDQELKLAGQRQVAAVLGASLAKTAKFKRDHQVVLLRIGDRGADVRYETVRHDWRIGRRWIDPRASRSPRWAVIVAGALIVAVYRIERWEPTPLPGPPGGSGAGVTSTFTARSTYRHSFVGEADDELERRYVGRSVAAYLGASPGPVRSGGVGAQNQVTYVWCGPHWVNPVG